MFYLSYVGKYAKADPHYNRQYGPMDGDQTRSSGRSVVSYTTMGLLWGRTGLEPVTFSPWD